MMVEFNVRVKFGPRRGLPSRREYRWSIGGYHRGRIVPWTYRKPEPGPPMYWSIEWLWMELTCWNWRGWEAKLESADPTPASRSASPQ